MRLNIKAAVFAAFVACLFLVLHSGKLWGCLPPYCGGGYFLPGGGSVPANVGAIKWLPYHETWHTPEVDETNVSIARISGTEEIEVPFVLERVNEYSYILRLPEDLVPGSDYILRCDDQCEGTETIEAGFLASTPSPSPLELGRIVAGEARLELITVATPSGSCDTPITAAIVDVVLELNETAARWADVFSYKTLVDGEEWTPAASLGGPSPAWEFGGSWMGRGKDRLYVLCAASDPGAYVGLEEGSHWVEMGAALPGSDLEIRSSAVSVELFCTMPAIEEDEDEAEVEVDVETADVAAWEIGADAGEMDASMSFSPACGGCSIAALR